MQENKNKLTKTYKNEKKYKKIKFCVDMKY